MPHIDSACEQCPCCGEVIEVPVEGAANYQTQVEKCSVCCEIPYRTPMPFLRTTLATDWPPPTWLDRLLRPITANPGYLDRMHRVRSWLIEFDDEGLPGREIGLDAEGGIVLAGPGNGNYGYWHDTNMRLQDFPGEPVDGAEFEALWRASGVIDD